MSNFTQVTDFGSLFTQVQAVAPFAELTVLATFFITVIALSRYGTKQAVVASCFIAFITSAMFFFLNMMGSQWLYACLFATAASAYLIND